MTALRNARTCHFGSVSTISSLRLPCNFLAYTASRRSAQRSHRFLSFKPFASRPRVPTVAQVPLGSPRPPSAIFYPTSFVQHSDKYTGHASEIIVCASRRLPHFHLQSNICPSTTASALIAAIALVTIVYWAGLGEEKREDVELGPSNTDIMSSEIMSGHLGNLTSEQEHKLLKLWGAILKICDVADANGAASEDSSTTREGKAVSESETPKKKRGFGLLGSRNATSNAPEDDKYGLTQQYQEILASEKAEDIRETIWSMMKHDHPDALVLRFLRARKWDIEKALVMLISAMNWRHSKMNVDQDIMKNGEAGAVHDEKHGTGQAQQLGSGFLKQSRMGKSFLHGTDKEGRPICVVRVRLHKASDQSAESLERYTVFIIETARLALQAPVDTAVSSNSSDCLVQIIN